MLEIWPGRSRPRSRHASCELRPWMLEDASVLREACRDTDICRFTTVPVLYSQDAAMQWIERRHAHARAGTAIVPSWPSSRSATRRPSG
jgi:hypothetical protein